MGLLDDPPFLLSHPDAVLLVQRLTDLLGDKVRARNVARLSGINEGDVDWTAGPMAEVWPGLLQVAARERKLRVLVERAHDAEPAEELFDRLVSESANVVAVITVSPADLWGTPRLWRTEAMIDRAELRDNLRAMLDPDGYRALFVTGVGAGTGKSHTRRYMSYLAEKGQLPRLRIIDNSRRAGTPMSVQEVAQLVASTLTGDKAPKFDLVAQQESIVTQFRGWLNEVSATFADPIWLVFDGFTTDTASASALQLIHDLAVSVAEYQLGLMRVAVCGFDGVVPMCPGALREPLRHPTDEDVKAFFKRMSKVLRPVESDDAAVDLVFDDFVGRSGAVRDRPLTELGPSALAFALEVYGAVTT
jgi:hypothetical protein